MKNEDQEINNNSPDFQIRTTKIQELDEDEDENDLLSLSLSFLPTKPRRALLVNQPLPPPPPPPPPLSPLAQSISMQALLSQTPAQMPLQPSATHPLFVPPFVPESSTSTPSMFRQEGGPSRSLRVRRNPTHVLREGKSDTIPAPFPWATTHRATVHSLNYLLSNQIHTITGDVQCKKCEHRYKMEYNLKEKLVEVGSFVAANKSTMHDRAPSIWMNPVLPTCKFCEQKNSAKPIISAKKKAINWLFLLLGQMLGCCTLEQLKYFCKHTKNHRTGAKDRVLYLTYLGLCKQLDPDGPFDR